MYFYVTIAFFISVVHEDISIYKPPYVSGVLISNATDKNIC